MARHLLAFFSLRCRFDTPVMPPTKQRRVPGSASLPGRAPFPIAKEHRPMTKFKNMAGEVVIATMVLVLLLAFEMFLRLT